MVTSVRSVLALVALASSSAAFAGQPVQTYTRSGEPSRSEGLRSLRGFIPAADPREGLLITPAPHPDAKVDSPDREELGRAWSARGPVGNRTPVSELVRGQPGAASFGAAASELDQVVWVQPEEIDTVVALSPWQQVDDSTLRQILRHERNLGNTRFNPSSERLLNELRAAQKQWLEEQGYILNVRTHVNNAARPSEPSVKPASEIKPRGVIRVVPQAPAAKTADAAPASAE